MFTADRRKIKSLMNLVGSKNLTSLGNFLGLYHSIISKSIRFPNNKAFIDAIKQQGSVPSHVGKCHCFSSIYRYLRHIPHKDNFKEKPHLNSWS